MTSPDQSLPQVTVIMPVYNGQDFVREALESVFAQTFQSFEVIVIDDDSTDSTPQILKEYGDRITVLHQKKQGHVIARNTAKEIARGEWIAMLDADDIWEVNALEEMMKLTRGVDVVYCARSNFGDSERVDEVNFSSGDVPQGDIFEDLIMDNFITHSGVMIRRSTLNDVGGYDGSLKTTCDWELWLRLAATGHLFAGSPLPLVRYRWRATSHSKNHQQTCLDRVAILEKALQTDRGRRVSPAKRRQALSCVWATSAWFVAAQDDRTALRWYLNSVRYQPASIRSWKEVTKCCLSLMGLRRSDAAT
ncbi:MAG: glycosyltransferase [Planctomycetaceae bacterium]|nr:glycosyltransferase [Planctomycetaceae bacterium]